ncbi:MAG: tyrosine--tRNA ligase [Patescibacteria group bacterium]
MNNKIQELLSRNIEEVIIRKHLEERLKSGKKLRIKLGADPTAPDLHLGHSVVLWKLREFQDLGHKIVFIIGDYTAKIGDPSGRLKARPSLTENEIKKNAQTYFKQVGKILDIKKTEIRYNSQWFSKLNFADLIKLCANFSLWRILERDDFVMRHKEGKELLVHEILYSIMQAYDSIMIKADVEIGGTDQKFNMLAGRDLQRKMGISEQNVITCPLLVGLDGKKKMSKSLGNYIGLTDLSNQMFGKIMSLPDNLILQYFKLATLLTDEKIKEIEKEIIAGKNPRDLKARLGREIVALYYGKKQADLAEKEFNRVFQRKEKPSQIPKMKISEKNLNLLDLVMRTKFTKSRSEGRRLILQGGVRIDDKVKQDWQKEIKIKKGIILQIGKRKFVRII